MRRPRPSHLLLVALFVTACSDVTSPTSPDDDTNAAVVRVVDGDTVDVRIADRVERVRLIGIDTPESVRPDSPVECYGPEASAFTTQLLPAGTRVRLERDLEPRDPYDRLLAYVFLADGTFVNLEIVRTGHATVLPIEPNTTHSARFAVAEREARDVRAGMWAACSG